MFRPEGVILRENVWKNNKLAYDEWWFETYLYNLYEPETFKADKIDIKRLTLTDLLALYYGLTACADDMVGLLMQALISNEIDDRTIVVFLSDHGDNFGSHHLFNKSQLYEESIRVPMIFSGPGVISNYINKHHVAQIIDVMPTLLELAGEKIPKTVQGNSLAPILTGNAESLNNNYAFIETKTDMIDLGIRTPEFLYGVRISEKEEKIDINNDLYLFNVTLDPYQLNNLVKTDNYYKLREELREKIVRWNNETSWLKVDEEFVKPEWLIKAEEKEKAHKEKCDSE
jgi:arylsulfatase A-like enzyme